MRKGGPTFFLTSKFSLGKDEHDIAPAPQQRLMLVNKSVRFLIIGHMTGSRDSPTSAGESSVKAALKQNSAQRREPHGSLIRTARIEKEREKKSLQRIWITLHTQVQDGHLASDGSQSPASGVERG